MLPRLVTNEITRKSGDTSSITNIINQQNIQGKWSPSIYYVEATKLDLGLTLKPDSRMMGWGWYFLLEPCVNTQLEVTVIYLLDTSSSIPPASSFLLLSPPFGESCWDDPTEDNFILFHVKQSLTGACHHYACFIGQGVSLLRLSSVMCRSMLGTK